MGKHEKRTVARMKKQLGYAEEPIVSQPQIPPSQPPAEAWQPPSPAQHDNVQPPKKKNSWVGEVFFYGFLLVLVAAVVLVRFTGEGQTKGFLGYSAFTVLTSSMESVYPKGSLVVTRSVPEESLQVGDDITFMTGPSTTITHRIISITENYLETGRRGFETQGVMNQRPDAEIVAAANVVGKVVFSSRLLGKVVSFVQQNWPILIFVTVVLVGMSIALKYILKKK